MDELNLDDLLSQITPNILTPKLKEITTVANDKKPRTIAQLLVKHLHAQLGSPPMKEIYHEGSIHQIRYFDITPMMKGVWCEVSLMLLHLSYGEQCSLIEALYPKEVQLTAKIFASHFTNTLHPTEISIQPDNTLVHLLTTANAGIAMTFAALISMGAKPVHPDVMSHYLQTMETVAEEKQKRDAMKVATDHAKQANKSKDKERNG